jgi:hypothetical protein
VIGESETGDPCANFAFCDSYYCSDGICAKCEDDTYCATLGGTCDTVSGECSITECTDDSACTVA